MAQIDLPLSPGDVVDYGNRLSRNPRDAQFSWIAIRFAVEAAQAADSQDSP
jgi:hypothetical protein